MQSNLLQPTGNRDPVRGASATAEAVLASLSGKAAQTDPEYLSTWLEVGIGRCGCASFDLGELSVGGVLEVVLETALTNSGSDPYGPRVLKEIAIIESGEKGALERGVHRRVSFEATDRYIRVAVHLTKKASATYRVTVQLGP